jgi:hypothetical protein
VLTQRFHYGVAIRDVERVPVKPDDLAVACAQYEFAAYLAACAEYKNRHRAPPVGAHTPHILSRFIS